MEGYWGSQWPCGLSGLALNHKSQAANPSWGFTPTGCNAEDLSNV